MCVVMYMYNACMQLCSKEDTLWWTCYYTYICIMWTTLIAIMHGYLVMYISATHELVTQMS